MTNTRASQFVSTLGLDRTVAAIFTVVAPDGSVEELQVVTRNESGASVWRVWWRPFDGQEQVSLVGAWKHLNKDRAMSVALSNCGWGPLHLTEALDAEGRGEEGA